MKVNVSSKYYITGLIVFLWIVQACAPERKGVVANAYHNTTARYNSYYYAQERMNEIQVSIQETQENNFNKVLRVLPDIDTTVISSLSEKIEDCLKKASISVERHPNSEWADDSYILIGQCRLYNQNYEDAIKTFKYVNTESENDMARHQALIKLMRTFIEAGEQNNAVAVSDYLKKEKLNRESKVQLALTRAYLYQINEDYSGMIANLLTAAPLMKNTEGRARTYYIIAQVYQDLNFDAQAYENYEQVLKSNPEYELYFYARLNMAQVYDLSREKDTKKIRKYFRKLLKDNKNLEYRDKIYYEMAAFEQKLNNIDLAIDYYKSSVRVSTNNNRQKAYSYLALGRIYYDSAKYQLAKNYYDSTISVLPNDEEEYEQISTRQKVLADFVEQLNTIEEQDSLLALAAMDTSKLSAYLDQVIAEEQKAEEEKAKKEKREQVQKSRNSRFPEFDSPFNSSQDNSSEGQTWYFYSQATISQGRTAFTRKWGDRPLEDNWRRSTKGISERPVAQEEDTAQDEMANGQIADAEDQSQSPEAMASQRKQILYAGIPFSDEQQQEALGMIETAYYRLGGIYDFDLKEKQNAIEAFETLLSRFPESEYEPEVLYQLYLIYKELNDNKYITYKNRLLENFPESLFAKIIINPNYRQESNLASEQMKKTYKDAYRLFEEGEYAQAEKLVNASLKESTDNSFYDNMALLKAMITGKRESKDQYQLALQKFIEDYPESDLIDYANVLLDKVRNFDTSKMAKYIAEFDEKHSFVIIYKNAKNISSDLPNAIEAFNKQYFPKQRLTTTNLMLDNGKVMVLIEQFADKKAAEVYYQRINGEESPLSLLPPNIRNNIGQNFVITEDNLNILYKTKDIENYVRFFEKNYM